MGGIGIGELFIWLLTVAAIVAVAVAIVRVGVRLASRDGSQRLLRERFARGEITQAEFEQARRTLGS